LNPEGISPSVSFGSDGRLGEEGQEAVIPTAPVRPTEAEVEIHNATHIPFRSWCPHCVAGRAKSNPHHQTDQDRPCAIPVVSLDYAFMGEKDKDEPVE